MSGKSWFEKVKVPYFLVDYQGKMSVPQLMTYLIYVSGQQTNALTGPSADDYGLSWIIIQYQIEIYRYPVIGEMIETETVANEYNRVFSYRDFNVRDESGELLVKVTATFALMDENRKLTKIPEEIVAPYGSEFSRKIRRNPKPEVSADTNFEYNHDYRVRYFDIDENNHANNAHYFSWMLDTMPTDFLKEYEVAAGNLMFEKEVRADEIVSASAQIVDDSDTLRTKHVIRVNGQRKAVAEFTWRKK